MPQQSASGGKGAPPPSAPLKALGHGETPPTASRLLSPPPFPPVLMDEPRGSAWACVSLWTIKGGKEETFGNCQAAAHPGQGSGRGPSSPGRLRWERHKYGDASCKDSLPQNRSFKLSTAPWRSWVFIWLPPSWYKISKTSSNLITPFYPP